jgi:hypothetical protein
MEYINTKKSHSGFSPFLLIWVFLSVILVVMIILDAFEFNFSVLLFFAIIFVPPILFFLDIFLWHVIGKEIIYTQDEKIIIKKINRIRPRKKIIQFKKIEDIYLWKEKGFLNDTYSQMSAFWDWDKQGTICIKYDNGCKYYIGRNLNDAEAKELMELLKSEIIIIPTTITMKSQVIEWVVFGFVILLIIVVTVGFIW